MVLILNIFFNYKPKELSTIHTEVFYLQNFYYCHELLNSTKKNHKNYKGNFKLLMKNNPNWFIVNVFI